MKKTYYSLIILLFPVVVWAQFEAYLQKEPEPISRRQAGVAVSVIESGTGLGGFYYLPVKHFFRLGVTANFFMLRDNGQVEYYDPYYGTYITLGKVNNVYLIDLLFTVKKRLFPYEITNDLQPYIALSVGPVYGMNYPEDHRIRDQFSWAFTVAGAAGVDIVMEGGYLFGLRLQYRYMKFSRVIGERQNHSTADIRLEIGKVF